jgi:hypothetical protein
MTIDEITAKKRLKIKRPDIILLEYTGWTTRDNKLKCDKCGNEWSSSLNGVIKSSNCPNCCIINQRFTMEYIKNYIESHNCEYISGDYINATSNFFIKFECGHVCKIIWNDFRQGRRCSICGRKSRDITRQTKKSAIINILKKNSFEFVDFPNGYISQRKSYIRYKCKLGHITKRLVMNMIKYPTCNECKMLELSKIHKGELNPQWEGGVSSLTKYLRNRIKNWKRETMQDNNYECYISHKMLGNQFEIHHLIPFADILKNVMDNNNFEIKNDISQYTIQELNNIENKFLEEHDKTLGVCLNPHLHDLFHSIYGVKNFTPENFYEFANVNILKEG